jgi:hypothetical protein
MKTETEKLFIKLLVTVSIAFVLGTAFGYSLAKIHYVDSDVQYQPLRLIDSNIILIDTSDNKHPHRL